MIINWRKIADSLYNDLKIEIKKLGRKPTLAAILVWDNPASATYIRQKQKWADFVGISFILKKFPNTITEVNLLQEIETLNNDRNVDGFIVQLPLPKHISSKKVINAISPLKDVDGFHPENQGKVMIGDNSGFVPCTPAGIMKIFEHIQLDLTGKKVVVIGRSNIVGKPIANLLINAGATVSVCNSKTKKIDAFTRSADVVISAAGRPGLVKLSDIKVDTIMIDVWFTIVNGKTFGDADFNNMHISWVMATPVPWWVGPLTVAMLMKNTVKACINK